VCNAVSQDNRFVSLGAPHRVWAVSAIHGELERLYAIHDAILERLSPGDRIVYLGNYTGHGKKARETVDELLTFRRLVLAQPGMMPSDIIYLRGHQEQLWHRLNNIQFTQMPGEVLCELLESGLSSTLESYGISAYDGMRSCKEGVLFLTRWTHKIRETVRKNQGHEQFMTSYKRAAYTKEKERFPLLFVNSGVDPRRKLEEQGDTFWDSGDRFGSITQAYTPFDKVIRGYDPLHQGIHLNCVTATLDGGSGFGGSLVCAALDKAGAITEMLEA
jgi:hypothetical protein